MLAGGIIFYNQNNEVVYRVDLTDYESGHTIDIDTYINSPEFYKIIFNFKIEKAVSNIYYCNGLPVEEIIYERDLSNL